MELRPAANQWLTADSPFVMEPIRHYSWNFLGNSPLLVELLEMTLAT